MLRIGMQCTKVHNGHLINTQLFTLLTIYQLVNGFAILVPF